MLRLSARPLLFSNCSAVTKSTAFCYGSLLTRNIGITHHQQPHKSPSSSPALVSACRSFFFSSSSNDKKEEGATSSSSTNNTNEHEEQQQSTLKVSDTDLNLGNDMPPLLQYNESLVAAALRLVEFANEASVSSSSSSSESNSTTMSSSPITPEVEAGIANIMAMLFHEEYIPLVDQFQAIRELAKLDGIRKNSQLLEAVHEITAALVPSPVMGLIRVVDGDLERFDVEALEDVNHFIVLILEGQENDDEFVRALQTMQNRNPELEQSTPFISLLQNLNDVLLQSRLSYLLTEACLTFDPERTGKIKISELEDSLRRILPKEAVAKMMESVEGDENGCVAYAQMTRVLLRGKDIEVVGMKE